MNRFATLASLAASVLTLSTAAIAGTIPYANVGTVAPQSALTAASTGEIYGYFLQGGHASGGSAGNTDYIRLVDLTSGYTSGWLFNNQTTSAGTKADFGAVTAGDTLVFELNDTNISQIFASQATLSADGVNHAYITAYGGATVNGTAIPAGAYVGMEDLNKSNSDFNYADDTFVFTNVSSSVTPEPSSLVLLGSGLVGAAGAVRRRLAR